MISELQKNSEFLRAFDLFENSQKNIFLTGRAGTGKSTLLQYFRSSTRKNLAVLAPTGVAAVNVKGQTIHSFFCFRPDITPESVGTIHVRRSQREVYAALDAVIIDEISMVRADLLDCIDSFLRIHGKNKGEPFGGVQMIFIGDLLQLPPVVTRGEKEIFENYYVSPYFFDARVFAEMEWEFMELETIYRQTEDRFIQLLNAVRDNRVTREDMELLNSRYKKEFSPSPDEFYVYLTTTNDLADSINRSRLSALKGKEYEYAGDVTGKFEDRNLPTKESLRLKMGAQVMLLNNDPEGRWVNGSIGQVADILHSDGEDAIRVLLNNGLQVDVTTFTWEMYRFVYDETAQRVVSDITGTFTQYPLRLAWAVTIHKAQGKTFSKVVIDIGDGTFSHGQTYVALSRATCFEGIVLRKPILKHHIMTDSRVLVFMEKLKNKMQKTHIVLE